MQNVTAAVHTNNKGGQQKECMSKVLYILCILDLGGLAAKVDMMESDEMDRKIDVMQKEAIEKQEKDVHFDDLDEKVTVKLTVRYLLL